MNTYSGQELMQHPELNIDTASIGPLLNNQIIDDLQLMYLKVISFYFANYKFFLLVKTLKDVSRGCFSLLIVI